MQNKPSSQARPLKKPATAWTGRTRGGYYGNLFFIQMLRLFGLRAAFMQLWPICAYYLLAHPTGRRASADYLTRIFGPLPAWRRTRLIHKHFISMGKMLLERMAMINNPAAFQCSHEGIEHLQTALGQGRGLVLVSAHLGNWEAAGHLLGDLGTPLNVVGVNREVERINNLFEQQMSNKTFRFITLDQSPLDTLTLLTALRRNEIVALHGDRFTGNDVLERPFLGKPAKFPLGAYRLAAVAETPVIHAFSVRESPGKYRFLAYPPMLPPSNPDMRDTFFSESISLYVERIEALVRQYPLQWYNFYPFWE